jgi:DNA-binding FadR family transcriptional regulator
LSRRFWYKFYQPHDFPVAANAHADIMTAIIAEGPVAAADASDGLLDDVGTFTRYANSTRGVGHSKQNPKSHM